MTMLPMTAIIPLPTLDYQSGKLSRNGLFRVASEPVRNVAALAAATLGLLLGAGSVARAAPESEAASDPGAALMEAGKALMNEKRYLEAAEKFQAAVTADPSNDLGWYQLASAHRKAERCDRAIAAYKRYMDLVPTVP